MSTNYNEVYDLFLVQIKDWKLDALYDTSVSDFETYLQGFLVLTIPEFTEFSDQDLTRNDATSVFTETLTDKNKQMLASMMVKEWLSKEIQDVRQIKLHVGDKDFRVASEANNLRAKESYLVLKLEEISQDLIGYSWYAEDFTDWTNGTFAVV